MKITVIFILALILLSCRESETSEKVISTKKTDEIIREIKEEDVKSQLTKELAAQNIQVDFDSHYSIAIGDVNNDGFDDAVIEYFIDDPQAHLDFGRSAIYSVWKIAILLNSENGLKLSDNIPLTDLVSLSIYDGVSDLKLKENRLILNKLRDRRFDDDAGNYEPLAVESIQMEFFINDGKFEMREEK